MCRTGCSCRSTAPRNPSVRISVSFYLIYITVYLCTVLLVYVAFVHCTRHTAHIYTVLFNFEPSCWDGFLFAYLRAVWLVDVAFVHCTRHTAHICTFSLILNRPVGTVFYMIYLSLRKNEKRHTNMLDVDFSICIILPRVCCNIRFLAVNWGKSETDISDFVAAVRCIVLQ